MANSQKKNLTSYTYESADGSKITLQAGQDGVTEKWLAYLRAEDAAITEQEDYQRKHLDYGYQNALAYYERDPENTAEHPMNQFQDPNADIFRILYPEEAEDSPLLAETKNAIQLLSDAQKDLIYELYGLCRTINEIAHEQGVTKTAIQNRRNKIVNRIKKIIETQKP